MIEKNQMAIGKDQIEEVKKLQAQIKYATENFYHSTPLAHYTVKDTGLFGDTEVTYGIRSILLLAALTHNNTILPGRSQSGKTHLAKMIGGALFGKDCGFLPVDATLNENKLRDLAFSAIKEGKNLHEAVQETKLITAPCVIVDEYNRAPYEVTNMLQGYLQNGTLVFEGGKELVPGVSFSDGKYQWKIATFNEGKGYYGTREVEKASRNRLPIEIPVDIFPPTENDKRKLVLHGRAGLCVKECKSLKDVVIGLYEKIKKIPFTPHSEEFIMYLTRLDQCKKSPEKSKLTVENFSMEYCKQCRIIAKDQGICANVSAPNERSIIALSDLSRGFALMRAVQYTSHNEGKAEGYLKELQVTIEDLLAAAPFALYSKIDIEPNWVAKYAGGSKWNATINVIKTCYSRMLRYFTQNRDILERGAKTPEDIEKLKNYAVELDAWCLNLRDFEDF